MLHARTKLRQQDKKEKVVKKSNQKEKDYNFADTMDYYTKRDENFIVGIISKNLNKLASSSEDLFKIREKRGKNLKKKRGTGIPTLKGAVCSTSKDKGYLLDILKKLPNSNANEIKEIKSSTRINICNLIREKLLYLEKYSTKKDKITYMMIPMNHPKFPFPYNLEDRIKSIKEKILLLVKKDIEIKVTKSDNGKFLDKSEKEHTKYILTFKNKTYIDIFKKDLEKIGAKLDNKKNWILIIE